MLTPHIYLRLVPSSPCPNRVYNRVPLVPTDIRRARDLLRHWWQFSPNQTKQMRSFAIVWFLHAVYMPLLLMACVSASNVSSIPIPTYVARSAEDDKVKIMGRRMAGMWMLLFYLLVRVKFPLLWPFYSHFITLYCSPISHSQTANHASWVRQESILDNSPSSRKTDEYIVLYSAYYVALPRIGDCGLHAGTRLYSRHSAGEILLPRLPFRLIRNREETLLQYILRLLQST